eukprot:TRINITY_DN18162_c1_g1_i2.p1 TRINITY_DN18162_c1_g1~~TRINITY_DN18162_c1_g1_i2.p1  ORF type:complete len:142 (+),score=49.40 TRINITY_DN18162_c1_g1_i2:36-428(+)
MSAISSKLQKAKQQSKSLLSDASVLPLLACSFGKQRAVSSACLQLLTTSGEEVLAGRERQIGVIYATHPLAATLISGVYKSIVTTIVSTDGMGPATAAVTAATATTPAPTTAPPPAAPPAAPTAASTTGK